MSKLVADKIVPSIYSADKLNIGGTGDSVVILDSLSVNEVQDIGGNNIFTSDGAGNITSKNSGLSGGLNLISTQTASGDASVSFSLDSTYDVYCFKFINIHASSDAAHLRFQGSTDNGSSYGVTATTTFFVAFHAEDDSSYSLTYDTGWDLAQSTSYQPILIKLGTNNDEDGSGELYIFAPSSTTYVKHFYSRGQTNASNDLAYDAYCGGYFNTTSAITNINFACSAGNIDAGTITLFGVSKS